MDLRLWVFSLVMIQLCSDTPSGQFTGNVCREPLTEIPQLVRSYPKNQHRFAEVADFLLGVGMDYVSDNYLDRVAIPDVDKTLTVSIYGFSITSSFHGQDGWVENLSTLQRMGQVVTNKHKRGSVVATSYFKIKSLIVGFDKYKFPLGRFAPDLTGDIKIKINDNRIKVKTIVEADRSADKCAFSLEDLKIEKLGGFRATVTGLGVFNFLLQIITNGLLEGQQAIVKAEIEGLMRSAVRNFLQTLPCGVCD